MKQLLLFIYLLLAANTAYSQKKSKTTDYFPPYHTWQHQSPQALGLKDSSLRKAISFAISNEVHASRDGVISQYQSFGKEPFSNPVGPLTERGAPTGIIIYKGYIVAEWGEPNRVDIVKQRFKKFPVNDNRGCG